MFWKNNSHNPSFPKNTAISKVNVNKYYSLYPRIFELLLCVVWQHFIWIILCAIWYINVVFQNYIRSDQISPSVVSDSLWPHESQHTRLPVHHQLPEFTETHVQEVCDAIQPSHPLSSLSPLVPNPSQHQSPFQWVNISYEGAKVLEFQL